MTVDSTVRVSFRLLCFALFPAARAEGYPEPTFQSLVKKIMAERTHSDEKFRRVPQSSRPAVAMQIIRKEVKRELVLPSFEEWWAGSSKIDLFS